MTLDNPNVDELIAKLKTNIDRLHSSFEKVKYQILEVARILDESKQCERSYICRKIKQLLQDKIKEGKITSKWIEDCLPEEYKRRYIKSEFSSLSKQGGIVKEPSDQQLTQVDNASPMVIVENKGGEDVTPSIDFQVQNEIKFQDRTNNQDVTRDSNILHYTLLIENSELKINGTELRFMIHRKKYEEVNNTMEKSTDFIYMYFDQLGPYLRAEPDV